MVARAYLFVPADRPERYAKALASGADRVIVDLEDAVGPAEKNAARAMFLWLRANGQTARVLIRVNGVTTPWHAEDMALAALPGVAGLVLPKAESALMAGLRAGLRPDQELHAMVESVAGFAHLRDLAGTPGLTRLAFGALDFCSDAGIVGDDRELDAVRTQIVIESRHAGLSAPIDGVTVAIDDAAALEADIGRARSFGFGGKLCIHPKQVAAVKRGFLPTGQERLWAAKVLAAMAANPHGAIAVDGKLVDKPIMNRAKAIASAESD